MTQLSLPLPTPTPTVLSTDWQRIGLWFSGATDDRPACLQNAPQPTRAAPVVPGWTPGAFFPWRRVVDPCGCVYRVRRYRVLAKACAGHRGRG